MTRALTGLCAAIALTFLSAAHAQAAPSDPARDAELIEAALNRAEAQLVGACKAAGFSGRDQCIRARYKALQRTRPRTS